MKAASAWTLRTGPSAHLVPGAAAEACICNAFLTTSLCRKHFKAALERRRKRAPQVPAGTAQPSDNEGRDLRVFVPGCCVLLDFNAQHRLGFVFRNEIANGC
jgi:hypothetical protein